MPSAELLWAFFTASLVFAVIPGPAMLYAAAQTLACGRGAGLMATLGLHVGGYAHVVASATGLTALFVSVPSLFAVLKWVGALYLAWLGISILWRAYTRQDQAVEIVKAPPKSGKRAFRESVTVELLNPKTALFFIAFLPQFVDPAAAYPVWVQLIVLGTLANVMMSSADLICVLFAGKIFDSMRQSQRATRILEGLGGGVLIGLGAHLASQRL